MNAIITGGTKGIGRSTVKLFAANGIHLSVCSRNQKELESLRFEIIEKYPNINVHIKQVDVSNKHELLKYAEEASTALGKIDILINNAGIFIPGQIHEEEDSVLERTLDVNLLSVYHLTRAILPGMIQRKKGYIVNMCSIASVTAYPNGGSYSISKFALLGFSRCLREELKSKGIKVTSILPGATWSASWEGVDQPITRLMQPDDIAKVIYNAVTLGESATVEEVIIRPQLGDL
ncbi:MAG TPA: SDR family oxidoreductase [Saprospiraceae bacterium]|nr:SDR family oxidoreductase [Saprospiraceae bacterium]